MRPDVGLRLRLTRPTFRAERVATLICAYPVILSLCFGIALLLYGEMGRYWQGGGEEPDMDNKMTIGVQKSWTVYLGFALLFGSVLASSAQNMETDQRSRVVVTRENLHSFSSGSGCKSVPYTGLVEGRAFIVAEAFVRMELWTQEGLEIPVQQRERLVDSRIYFHQGNAYADWYPDRDPGGVCPELEASLAGFPKELEGMLDLVQNNTAQADPPCEPAIALTVDGNRVVESYELVTDCGLH